MGSSQLAERTVPSICRVCHNYCPILVTVVEGKAVRVTGDRSNELYEGYTCVKGRALPELMSQSGRLMHSMKRTGSGDFVRIDVRQAMDEIAERLTAIIDRDGGSAIATYLGTHAYVATSLLMPIANAFSDAIGSQRRFSPITIDQPGKVVAPTMHGVWMAPTPSFQSANVALFVGMNPLISHYLAPAANPGRWLEDAKRRSVKLLVVDPRRTELARRAFVHLQPRPGQDVPILAAMLRVILEEGLSDQGFTDDNVGGIDLLREAVGQFTPEEAGRRAGVLPDDIVLAARTFATSGPGWAFAGTGPSMAQSSTVLEYLMLCLKSVCGYYQRAGQVVGNPGTLRPAVQAKAQALSPALNESADGPRQDNSYAQSLAGEPIGTAADRMQVGDQHRIRALLSCSGNPVAAWPDQLRTVDGLRSLDLLVQIDPFMSETSKLADYVIAPTMCLEAPATTLFTDLIDAMSGPCLDIAHGQYTPAVVEPPDGSDVIEEWKFIYGIAQRMGLSLTLQPLIPDPAIMSTELDMVTPPSTDRLLELTSIGSRIPLDEVKRHPHGALFPDPAVLVQEKDPGWQGRLEVGHPNMMADIAAFVGDHDAEAYPFRMICRMMHVFNSCVHHEVTHRGRAYNPAFMNPADIEALTLTRGDIIDIRSTRATIQGIVEPDASVRPGCVSMSHAFGGSPDDDSDFREVGSSTARLLDLTDVLDSYSGQPRMSGIQVAIQKSAIL
jgi:anaerobic selenocysteine-containing dehydrogenase